MIMDVISELRKGLLEYCLKCGVLYMDSNAV